MSTILVIDFDDSFVHNICEFLNKLGFSYKLIHHSLVDKSLLESFSHCLLGPGPGHVEEYENISQLISTESSVNFLGICLGFQMIGVELGFSLKQKKEPLHGVSLELPRAGEFFGINDFKGQFYNSWYVEKNSQSKFFHVVDQDMVVLIKHKNLLGVQFHPESVGSVTPIEVFKVLFQVLHD